MMELPLSQPKPVAMKPWMQIELLMASILPVTTILILGVIGSRQLVAGNSPAFLLLILVGAVLVFLGEMLLLLFTQRAMKRPLAELIDTYQEYTAGNTTRRAAVTGNDEAASLAGVFNTLLDSLALQSADTSAVISEQPLLALSPTPSQPSSTFPLGQLVQAIEPVLDGDLRIEQKLAPFLHDQTLGGIADICQYLIAELLQLVKWTRYSANHVMSSTDTLLAHATQLASTSETEMRHLAQSTQALEQTMATLSHTATTVQAVITITQEIQSSIQAQKKLPLSLPSHQGSLNARPNHIPNDAEVALATHANQPFLDTLLESAGHQRHLLDELLQSAKESLSRIEPTIGTITDSARQINESALSLLQTAQGVSSLSGLARQWRTIVAAFQLPDEQAHPFSSGPEEEDLVGPTFPIRS